MNPPLPKKPDLPREILEGEKWIIWRDEVKGGKITKVPHAPWRYGGSYRYPADPTDPENWTDFDTALEYARKGGDFGVGRVLSRDDDLVGIDFDDCIDEGGNVDEKVGKYVREGGSYTEISPSGNGLHTIGKGKIPGAYGSAVRNKDKGVEIYDKDRFLTITGRYYKKNKKVSDIQETVNELCEKYGDLEEEDVGFELKGADLSLNCLSILERFSDARVKKHGKGYATSHPVHGSDTGMNLTLKEDGSKFYCHRHGCGGGPFELFALLKKVVKCGSWSRGSGPLRGEKWIETIDLAEGEGLVSPEEARELAGKKEASLEDILKEEIERGESVHPVIDFNPDLGLTMGVVLLRPAKRKLLFGRDFLIEDNSGEQQLISNGVNGSINVRSVENMVEETNRLQLLKSAVAIKKNGKIGNKGKFGDFYCRVLDRCGYYWYHEDERWKHFVTSWIIGTYFFPVFECFPILRLQGERESGKTTLLKFLEKSVWNPTPAETNLRPAPLFRWVEGGRPTCLIDISDLPKNLKLEVGDLFESGYEKGGKITRCVGENNELRDFETYCPKAVASRSDQSFDAKGIKITTTQPPRGKRNLYTRRRDEELPYDEIRREARRLGINLALRGWRNVLDSYQSDEIEPEGKLCGRRFRLWRPILSVCRVCSSGDYDDLYELAKKDAETFTAEDFTQVVEDAVLVSALGKRSMTNSDLTESVSSRLNLESISYQRVSAALSNLGVVASKKNTDYGMRYWFNRERVEEKLDRREIEIEGGKGKIRETGGARNDTVGVIESIPDRTDQNSGFEKEIAQKLLWGGPMTAEEARSELDIEDAQFNEAWNSLAEKGTIVQRGGKWVHRENILGEP